MGKTLRVLVFLALLSVFVFSGWQVFSIRQEYTRGGESYESLARDYTVRQPAQVAQPRESLPEGETTQPMETAPAETAPITVDLASLQELCPDVVGWLYCPDTPIDYPVVQGKDNDHYLYRLLDGTQNSSGSIFLDYRCEGDFSGWNSILYGHNMKNDSMFGTLQEYKKQAYYEAHPVIYLLTPGADYRIDLIGGYTVTPGDKDTYGVPATEKRRDALLEKAERSSSFQTETEVSPGERLITLSTCAYDHEEARYVLVGVLRELASR